MHSRPLSAAIFVVLAWSPGMVLGVTIWLLAGMPGTMATAGRWGLIGAVPMCALGAVVGWRRAGRRADAGEIVDGPR